MNYIIADDEFFRLQSSWKQEDKHKEVGFHFPFKEFTIKYPDGSDIFIKTQGSLKCKMKFGIIEIGVRVAGRKFEVETMYPRKIKGNKKVSDGLTKMLQDIYDIILYFIAEDKSSSYTKSLEMVSLLQKGFLSLDKREASNTTRKTSTSKPSRNIVRVGVTKSYKRRPLVGNVDNKRQYNRSTDNWEVRGHYRQYKSGKKVWVESFSKGKGKGKDKEYIFR